MMEIPDKSEYIGNYLDKKLKNHGLPYSIQYFNLVAETEEKAIKSYNRLIKRLNKNK